MVKGVDPRPTETLSNGELRALTQRKLAAVLRLGGAI